MQWYYVLGGQRTGPVSQSEYDHICDTRVVYKN